MADVEMFPVLMSYRWRNYTGPREVPWSLLAPFEARAQRNHSQTLKRLAERGGLSPCEMVCILEGANAAKFFAPSDDAPHSNQRCECVAKLEQAIERERAGRLG